MIRITYVGTTGSDCTGPYYVDISKPMLVGDFIEEYLKEYPRYGPDGIPTVRVEFMQNDVNVTLEAPIERRM